MLANKKEGNGLDLDLKRGALLQRRERMLSRSRISAVSAARLFGSGTKGMPYGRNAMHLTKRTRNFDENSVQASMSRVGWQISKRNPTVSEIWRPKPTTPGLRHARFLDYSLLHKGRPVKHLTVGLRKTGGRGCSGRISMRWRGGGHKRRYRIIDFKRDVLDKDGIVERIEYDPNRTAHIALVRYPDLPEGENLRYIIAPKDLEIGGKIKASRSEPVDIIPGNAMQLRYYPLGATINNIEILPGKGSQIARSAGTFATVISRQANGYTLVKMCSGEERLILDDCIATVGVISNTFHRLRKLGKAGRKRWMGRRPRVRGVAMNPCDHPLGGGEARSKSGRPSTSKWGWTCKGRRTRNKHKHDFRIVTRRYNTKEWLREQAEKKKRKDGRETPQKIKRKAAAKLKATALKQKLKAEARASSMSSAR